MSPAPPQPVRVEHPPERPLLVFDGNCGFCKAWVGRWSAAAKGRLDLEPSTAALMSRPELAAANPDDAVLLVGTDGTVTRGAQAILLARHIAGSGSWLARAYHDFEPFARLSESVYGMVARNRPAFSTATRLLWGRHTERPSFATAVWLFLRALGVIYAIAFLSFWVQAQGLVGPDGIIPARDFLKAVADNVGIERFWFFPTLSWIFGAGWFLHVLCFAGLAAGVSIAIGRWQRIALVVAWVCYLSLVTDGQGFMLFQWDSLLLEAGFVAFFLTGPSRHTGWNAPAPSRLGLLLGKWLLFRLMFLSGAVKLTSGDPTWRHLDALKYHFESQPLPTWPGWFAHQLPGFMLVGACAIMFAIELVLPFLIWAPRRPRHFAFAGLVLLQVIILLTGNYTFFNWLTIALCLLMVSDDAWPRWLRNRVRNVPAPPPSGNVWIRVIVPTVAVIVLFCGAVKMPFSLSRNWALPEPVAYVVRAFAPLNFANNYGLFAVMTTKHPEIILQGSMDGVTWKDYELPWAPGDVKRRPRFVAPYQPRLDWQMWFESNSEAWSQPNPRPSRWFLRTVHQILKGEKPVLGLFEKVPFDGKAPRYMRVISYDYSFSTPGLLWDRGQWWRRGAPDVLIPEISLSDFGG